MLFTLDLVELFTFLDTFAEITFAGIGEGILEGDPIPFVDTCVPSAFLDDWINPERFKSPDIVYSYNDIYN